LDALTVLVTGSGAPGIGGTLYSLKNNFDGRQIRTIGTDVNKNAVGRCLCDHFYRIPRRAKVEEYLSDLLDIGRAGRVGCLLPQHRAAVLGGRSAGALSASAAAKGRSSLS